MKLEIDQEKLKEAVRSITQALEENEIPTMEGIFAMKMMIEATEKRTGVKYGVKRLEALEKIRDQKINS